MDKSFRDILGGSTTVVLGGDFKQTPLVMAEETREEIVNAGIKRSYFWKNIHIIMKLTRNMRLRNMGSDDELRHSFFDWVISIGNGSSDAEIYETWASILEELLFMEAIPTKCCSPKILHSLDFLGIPLHELRLKVGIPVMLLRIVDQSAGLCNGINLIITQLARWSLDLKLK